MGVAYSGPTFSEGYRWGLPMPGADTMGYEGKNVWQVDQTERSIYGSTTNPIHNMINHAILMAPLIPYILTEDCKKAAMDRQIAMRSNYKTLPIIGHDPVYYHRHHDKAKVFNVFRPEEGNKQWHTQYYIDTIRFTQPYELPPGLRDVASGFTHGYGGASNHYKDQNVSNIQFDTSKWGKSGVRVEA